MFINPYLGPFCRQVLRPCRQFAHLSRFNPTKARLRSPPLQAPICFQWFTRRAGIANLPATPLRLSAPRGQGSVRGRSSLLTLVGPIGPPPASSPFRHLSRSHPAEPLLRSPPFQALIRFYLEGVRPACLAIGLMPTIGASGGSTQPPPSSCGPDFILLRRMDFSPDGAQSPRMRPFVWQENTGGTWRSGASAERRILLGRASMAALCRGVSPEGRQRPVIRLVPADAGHAQRQALASFGKRQASLVVLVN
jgi:hypothetical protein